MRMRSANAEHVLVSESSQRLSRQSQNYIFKVTFWPNMYILTNDSDQPHLVIGTWPKRADNMSFSISVSVGRLL